MEQTIKPFKATYYNASLCKDHSDVVCPPYDVINKEQLKNLRRKSPYNFSHIIVADKKDYEKKRRLFDKFLSRGILVDDDRESFYLYEQKYRVDGQAFVRYGIMGLLKMDKKGIFPHEKTHKEPKEDRKKMIGALEANLSPIFVIAAQRLKALSDLHRSCSRKAPFIQCCDHDGNLNRLWRLDDPQAVAALTAAISKVPLVIADGHHRFEISYDYFKKHKSKYKDLDHVLAYVTDFQKGLTILPTHRIAAISENSAQALKNLSRYFNITQVSQAVIDKTLAKAKKFCMGFYMEQKFYFLELKNDSFLSKIDNKLFKTLDTYVAHALVLPLLAVKGDIEYSHSVAEAKDLAGRTKAAFLLRPAELSSVVAISRAGQRLPQKSTYFYPKLLSGLVVRRFAKH